MILKFFTQPLCPKCPAAKAIIKKIEHKIKLEEYDITTVDGLSEALYYNTIITPSIVIIDYENNIIGKFIGETPNQPDIERIIR